MLLERRACKNAKVQRPSRGAGGKGRSDMVWMEWSRGEGDERREETTEEGFPNEGRRRRSSSYAMYAKGARNRRGFGFYLFLGVPNRQFAATRPASAKKTGFLPHTITYCFGEPTVFGGIGGPLNSQ